VLATGEPLWFTGDRETLPPQIERALDAYIDVSHAQVVIVIPLARPASETPPDKRRETPPEWTGALVFEKLCDSVKAADMVERTAAIVRHSSAALANALAHHSLFLLPLWRALGCMSLVVRARNLPKLFLGTLLVGGAATALAIVPADFQLEARGTLKPAIERDVFAATDGVVVDVAARHGATVAAGESLATMRNTDLEVQLADVVGRREATSKQIHAIERALLSENRLSTEEQNRLTGQLLQNRETKASLDRQWSLLRQKQDQLQVASPIAGQVVTWQPQERLLRRPVRQGQVLMRLADPSGPWELELHVPEDRMGHIARAAQAADEPLIVTYILATHPGESHQGQITEMQSAAEVRGDEGNTVLVRVAVNKQQLPDLRPGAAVTAKVHCGQRSLGYVWLHDLVSFVQAKILFRL
jgi:multidrug efflux pump subunit AcrA (membrane-fusion protein)